MYGTHKREPAPVLISWSSKNIPKQIERQHNTNKSTITAPKTRATKLQQEKTRKSAMLPQATKTKYTHPFIPHKNSRMQVEEEEHLPPSAISLNQPPAGPRNLLLNSAQPTLGRLHFYIITIHHYYQNCGTERQ